MAEQIPFALPVQPSGAREDFLVTEANAQAAALIDSWPDWDASLNILVGPEGAGKSHLVAAQIAVSGAPCILGKDLRLDWVQATETAPLVIVEDADQHTDAESLFHLINSVRNGGRHMLVTAREAPSRWQVKLPDLLSRLNAGQIVRISGPDDLMLAAILMKQFSDRQISVEPDLIDYVVRRMPRDFASLQKLVKALDQQALSAKRAVTIPLARTVMEQLGY